MYTRSISLFLIVSLLVSTQAFSRVYKNRINVGDYSKSTVHIDKCKGTTFLQCMKDEVYPLIKAEADRKFNGKHIDGVEAGSGTELRLTEDISTYHVKYKKPGEKNAEQGGRSFSAVGKDQKKPYYVADASYSHYLSSLERVYTENPEELEKFYVAILKVMANSDASGLEDLKKWETKNVAADFVAVLVAEQYRHLLGGQGKYLGSRHNWDDALFQVTLLAGFHAGQAEDGKYMYYEGKFTNKVYNNIYTETVEEEGKEVEKKYCLYKKYYLEEDRERFKNQMRQPLFKDYWQFGRDRKCTRSGVNVTRSDFEKMGNAITYRLKKDHKSVSDLQKTVRIETDLSKIRGKKAQKRAKYQQTQRDNNLVKAVSYFFISNEAQSSFSKKPGESDEDNKINADDLVNDIVAFMRTTEEQADAVTKEIAK